MSGVGRYAIDKLPRDEMAKLIKRARRGDKRALDRITRSVLGYLYKRAARWRNLLPTVDVDDLVNDGVIGVMRAVDKFDPAKEVGFLTYAAWWIDNEMRERIGADMTPLGGGNHARPKILSGQYTRDVAELTAKGLTEKQILKALAKKYRMKEENVRAMRRMLRTAVDSLDEPIASNGPKGGNSDTVTRYDFIAAPGESPEEAASESENTRRIHAIIKRCNLDGRHTLILTKRLMTDTPQTLAEIGDQLGVSRERVRQIESVLLRRLAVAFAEFRPPAEPQKRTRHV